MRQPDDNRVTDQSVPARIRRQAAAPKDDDDGDDDDGDDDDGDDDDGDDNHIYYYFYSDQIILILILILIINIIYIAIIIHRASQASWSTVAGDLLATDNDNDSNK